jgi:hypothetical protein
MKNPIDILSQTLLPHLNCSPFDNDDAKAFTRAIGRVKDLLDRLEDGHFRFAPLGVGTTEAAAALGRLMTDDRIEVLVVSAGEPFARPKWMSDEAYGLSWKRSYAFDSLATSIERRYGDNGFIAKHGKSRLVAAALDITVRQPLKTGFEAMTRCSVPSAVAEDALINIMTTLTYGLTSVLGGGEWRYNADTFDRVMELFPRIIPLGQTRGGHGANEWLCLAA